MRVFTPGTLPQVVIDQLEDDIKYKLPGCHVSVTDTGMILYNVHQDHIFVQAIVGSGTKAALALRQYERQGLPIYFIGHTEHVVDWANKYFDPVGILYKYKGRSTCQQ